MVLETLQGAINTSLMTADCEVVSLYHRRIEHGYPTPSLGRDETLDKALPWLQQFGIWSRGRFGSYKVGTGLGTEGLFVICFSCLWFYSTSLAASSLCACRSW